MLDAQERLLAVQAGTAGLRVVMVTNGVVTPLVSTCNGLKFYSPNDLIVNRTAQSGSTDPGYNGNTLPPAASRVSIRLLCLPIQSHERQRHLHAGHHERTDPAQRPLLLTG